MLYLMKVCKTWREEGNTVFGAALELNGVDGTVKDVEMELWDKFWKQLEVQKC